MKEIKCKSRTRHVLITKSYMFRLYKQTIRLLKKKTSYVFRRYKQAVIRLLCSTVTSISFLTSQEYLKLVQRPLVHVLSLQVSHHISLLGPELNAREGIDARNM